MAREDQLIERVRRRFPSFGRGVRVGMGDDAAVIHWAGASSSVRKGKRGTQLSPGKELDWVLTTDAFLENVHFLRRVHPAKAVGYKALARATSDLAAMGARPRYFLMTLGLPAASTKKWLDNFLDGMALAARRFGLTLVGGDTTKYPSILVSLTVIGEIEPGRAVLRSGAKPGDAICVSGKLGEAELGLQLIQRKLHAHWKSFLSKHLRPEPRLALGRWLAAGRWATSLIDTSDGLSTDLGHLCAASGVGAKVFVEKLPLVNVPQGLQRLGFNPLRLGLQGGEDYELLFTVPKRLVGQLPRRAGGVSVAIIGEITREKKVVLVDLAGRGALLPSSGWDPFAARG